MSLPWFFRRPAQREFKEAAKYYQLQRAGLGEEFVEEVERLITAIAAQPDRYPIAVRDIREAQSKQFPYCLYYRVLRGRVVILSVFHNSRDPSIWQSRS